MFNSIYLVPKLNSENDPVVTNIIGAIKEMCNKITVAIVDTKRYVSPNTLVVAIGGDGTMLEAMRTAAKYEAGVIGINLGRVGFLTDIGAEGWLHKYSMPHIVRMLEDLLMSRQKYYEEPRTILQMAGYDDLACNEISVSRILSDSMITFRLRVDDSDAGIHRANTILVATSTGSTAYSLSGGGALMMPAVDALQIVPIAPLTMTSRPIIIPNSSSVTIDAWGKGIAVRADGTTVTTNDNNFTQETPFSVRVFPYKHKARLIHFDGWNFFNVLTQKLGWQKE